MSRPLPIDLVELPEGLRQTLGPIVALTYPRQGWTSDVAIAQTKRGRLVIKRSRGLQYPNWLEQEHQTLAALARETDPARRSALLSNCGAALRRLHDSPPLADLHTEVDWIDRALAKAALNLNNHPTAEMSLDLLRWLHENRPEPGPHGLIHGDCTVDNTLVLNGQVTGFIDWAGGAWGDLRYDLTLATRPKESIFREFREQDLAVFYAGYGCTAISDAEWRWFEELYTFF